jgi:uncharacterized membrane protein YsdA (DUF1294 family)
MKRKGIPTTLLFPIVVISVFYLYLLISILNGRMPMHTISYYIIISLFTFYVYFKDKTCAKNGTWRISEKNLHVLSVLGGWTGALLAQKIIRHKSSKTSFQIVFVFTILLNLVLLYKI